MSSKRNDSGKAKRRGGRSRRRLHAVYIALIAVLGTALVAMVGLGNSRSGSSADEIANATGTLSAAETFHDFGRISMKDGKVVYRYAVRNESDAPALVSKLYTSCMCTEASLLVDGERFGPFGMQGHGFIPTINRVIAPGQDAIVEAQFDPNAHGPAGIGRNDRVVAVEMGGQRVLQLQFTAYVTP